MNAIEYIKDRAVTYRFIEFMQTSDNSDLFLRSMHSPILLPITY